MRRGGPLRAPWLRAGKPGQPPEQTEVLSAGEILVHGGELPGQSDPAANRIGLGDDVVTQHPGLATVRS